MLEKPISQLWLSVLLYNCTKALGFQPAQAAFELSPSLNTALSESSNRENVTVTKSTSSYSCLSSNIHFQVTDLLHLQSAVEERNLDHQEYVHYTKPSRLIHSQPALNLSSNTNLQN